MPNKRPEYGDGLVQANRQPENRLVCTLDARGYVVSARLAKPGEGVDFFAVMRDTRREVDPATVVLPPLWPLTPEGRGLSVLECEALGAVPNHRAA